MDLILYCVILLSVGFMKMYGSKKVSQGDTLLKPDNFTEGTVQVVELPIGNNLRLYKEQDAYTLILQQFGLKR